MKIAIVGYGVEGRASYNYFSRSPENEIVVFDEFSKRPSDLPNDVLFVTGEHALEELKSQHFDKVLRTPPLAPSKLKDVDNVTSGTREFFEHCPAPIIGVTGTKGKGTISSLIYEILKAASKTVHLVGNIGKPALDVLPAIKTDDIVVYELSSFQLWDLGKSPQVAVISMVEPEHLDVHKDIDEYYQAKGNIRRYQTLDDYCFYHPANSVSKQIADMGGPQDPSERELWRSKSSRYAIPDDGAVYVKSNTFFIRNQQICPVDFLQLVGQHNVENACAAISAVLVYTHDYEAIENGIKKFKGLPHRIELVRTIDGVGYYDDSFSSAPPALKVAVASFEKPIVLIAGGKDRGLSFDDMAMHVSQRPNIKSILLYGETKELIDHALKDHGVSGIEILEDDLNSVVKRAKQVARSGDVVVFSPACASFDMFANFVERGEKFQKIVKGL